MDVTHIDVELAVHRIRKARVELAIALDELVVGAWGELRMHLFAQAFVHQFSSLQQHVSRNDRIIMLAKFTIHQSPPDGSLGFNHLGLSMRLAFPQRQGTQVAFSAHLHRYAHATLHGYRATSLQAEYLERQTGRPQKTSRGKAACYFSYPSAFPVGYAHLITDFAITGDLGLLLHHLVERFADFRLFERFLACFRSLGKKRIEGLTD